MFASQLPQVFQHPIEEQKFNAVALFCLHQAIARIVAHFL
jgi:hypothetical protein